VELESADVAPGEAAIAELGFSTPEELLGGRDEFETWSQIVLDGFGGLLAGR
jgi:hypothetical protein